jgi:NAD(P)H-dependent FMN reductase
VTRIGVILGTTRPGRRGEPVARWVMDEAGRRSDADFELVDLADYPLPHNLC